VVEQAAKDRDEMACQIADTSKRVASLTLEQMATSMEQFVVDAAASSSAHSSMVTPLHREGCPGGPRGSLD
jgi:hypothetical protein